MYITAGYIESKHQVSYFNGNTFFIFIFKLYVELMYHIMQKTLWLL